MDDYDLANKRFKESLTKKSGQTKDQAEIEKLVKQLQVMKVEIDFQRAEAIRLIQPVDGKQYEKLEKCLHVFLTHANHWDWKGYDKYSIFNVKRGNIKSRLSTIYYPIAHNFDNGPNWKGKCTSTLASQSEKCPYCLEELKKLKNIEKHLKLKLKAFHNVQIFQLYKQFCIRWTFTSLNVNLSLNIKDINLYTLYYIFNFLYIYYSYY